jgi:4-hydroxybenzoyl-CoA thioesterase
MSYSRVIPVEFNHCDPAGIVFFPRYFEMVNSVVETFFAEVLGRPFAAVVAAGHGVPTVRLESDFRAPSRLGDRLRFTLRVERAGTASLALAHEARAGEELRIAVRQTIVWTEGGRACPWPAEIRARIEAFQEDGDAQPA